jgi:phage recombination protein Bet
MSNELVKQQAATITDADLIMHLENMGLIKDLTTGEKNTFIQIAKAFNLNPFKREIYVNKYNGVMSIITGYETYIKRAERSGQLDGWECITKGEVATKDLKAILTIYRKDRSRPFVWEAEYNEYVQLTREGNVNKFWQKAKTMIKKVVMAQGFRLCFNDELGGMPYTPEETGKDEQGVDTTATVTDATPGSGVKADVKASNGATTNNINAATGAGAANTLTEPPKELKPLSVANFNKSLNKIAAGEPDVIANAQKYFIVSDEQLAQLNEAVTHYELQRNGELSI